MMREWWKRALVALVGVVGGLGMQGCHPDGLQSCETQADCFLEERCVENLCIEPEARGDDVGDAGGEEPDVAEDAGDAGEDSGEADVGGDASRCAAEEFACEEGCCWFDRQSLGGVGASSFVVMDGAGRPHLVYEDASEGAVMVVGPHSPVRRRRRGSR